ncbi:ImmA/IrrE family metallo-endopeptidase [Bacillus sp. JJ1562]|uniref:ImmA/IrrE family metallo-endopeptidase n=1 Tax=Bacillus sp. JJ1562 TaxID=3122960 RepID=UPI0030017CE4
MSWIKDEVSRLVTKHRTNNPFEIASNKNIHVIPWNLHEEIKGFYRYDKRNKYIFINNNLDEKPQHFVCAHELGHAILHPRANTPFLREKTLFSIDKLEVEANTFAVEMLLQDDQLYEYKDTSLSINEISEIFGVPKDLAHLKNF